MLGGGEGRDVVRAKESKGPGVMRRGGSVFERNRGFARPSRWQAGA